MSSADLDRQIKPRRSRSTELMQIPRFIALQLPAEVNLETQDGNSWPVSVKERNGTFYFSKGWHSFVRQNLLKTDDQVIFQLIPNEASRITVSIIDNDMLYNL
ncbi:hypothetical protein K1719_022987 [Acacia pycnantha]|nr:hypothetical protein K1719_022987 [Acacia pycnantha]